MIVTLWTLSLPGWSHATSACPASWKDVLFFSVSEITRLRRSVPIITLSLASSKSGSWTACDSGARPGAPLRSPGWRGRRPPCPGVPRAIMFRFTSSETGMFRVWTRRIPSRPRTSGTSTTICRSKRPGRRSAGIEHVGPVGRRDQDDPVVRFEAVHLHQELVQRLLPLVVAAAQAGAAVAAHRVDLVDEDDAGGVSLALVEEVAHARGADADEHLDEVGAREREEGNARFAGHGLGEERLPRARRSERAARPWESVRPGAGISWDRAGTR